MIIIFLSKLFHALKWRLFSEILSTAAGLSPVYGGVTLLTFTLHSSGALLHSQYYRGDGCRHAQNGNKDTVDVAAGFALSAL
jgi:hypothetical protein